MPEDEREILDAVFSQGRAARTVSAREIEEAGGLMVGELLEMVRAFGLRPPDPDEPYFDAAEAEVYLRLARVRDLWPPEVTRQVGRVYGRLLARIAQTEAQLFRLHVETRLRDAEEDGPTGLKRISLALEELLPLVDPVITSVHRRWLEHEVMQAAVTEVESGDGAVPLPGATSASILFCDLKDFTAYSVREGDAKAIRQIERLAEIITERRGEDCRLTKSIGDGYMLVYSDVNRAVSVGAAIVDAVTGGEPGVHASVHAGSAFVHEGDYFGAAVNLTARLLASAGRDQLVASAEVAQATADRFDWASLGWRTLRGVGDPVEVFRLNATR